MPKAIDHATKERALAMLMTGESAAEIARRLSLPHSTVKTWAQKLSKDLAQKSEEERRQAIANKVAEEQALKMKLSGEDAAEEESKLLELRLKKREEFMNAAWDILSDAQTVIARRIARAKDAEGDIDKIISQLKRDPNNKPAAQALSALKLESLRDIAVIFGTVYDKQALANKEPTLNVQGLVRFEEL